MDDERLKNWSHFWKDYFEELLARIRERAMQCELII